VIAPATASAFRASSKSCANMKGWTSQT
jgi:hypothetical protein